MQLLLLLMTSLYEKIYILTVQCIYIFTDRKMIVYVRIELKKLDL